jgi:murein DD-endopeptidase MepM/ murein hydrolase activator NlpD
VLLLPLGLLLAGADVYRSVDEHGNVQFTDHPSANAVRLNAKLPIPDPGAITALQVERTPTGADVYASNQIGGPVEIELKLTDASNVDTLPALPLRQVLPAGQGRVLVTRISVLAAEQPASYGLTMAAMPGDPRSVPRPVNYSLPLDDNSGWQVGQGFHGGFSHHDEQNLYAVDLIVPEGTPVLAARSGVVMQTESGFDRAGLSADKYGDRANLIRILHDDGSMAIYAHLKENGVYVRVGQHVDLGQQIGITGNTGFSSGPHLHFCVQVNRGMRLVSIPFRMVGPNGYLPLPDH